MTVSTIAATDRDVDFWVDRIRESMSRTVKAIIDTGIALIECKAALPHGLFSEAVTSAGMSPRVAQMFIAIANHPVLANASTYSHLPPAYNTLYQLSRLEPQELQRALEDETVSPKLKVNEASQLANMAQNARDRAELRMADATREEFEGALDAARAEGDLSRESVVSKLKAPTAAELALYDCTKFVEGFVQWVHDAEGMPWDLLTAEDFERLDEQLDEAFDDLVTTHMMPGLVRQRAS